MKKTMQFVSLYYLLNVLLSLVASVFFKEVSGEILGFIVWFFIANFVVTLLIFSCVFLAGHWLNTGFLKHPVTIFILLLLQLNLLPFFLDDHRFLFVDIVRGLINNTNNTLGFNNIGIVMASIVSFFVTYLLLGKRTFEKRQRINSG